MGNFQQHLLLPYSHIYIEHLKDTESSKLKACYQTTYLERQHYNHKIHQEEKHLK